MFTLKPINPARLNNPDTGEKTIFLDETDGNVKTKGSTGDILVVNESTVIPKVYRALLTQEGTDDPTAVVLENTLGGEVVWTRESVGNFLGTLVGAFTVDKTFAILGCTFDYVNGLPEIAIVDISASSGDDLLVVAKGGDFSGDDILRKRAIEIIVYP